MKVTEISGAQITPLSLRVFKALVAVPHEAQELFRARIGSSILVDDWFTLAVTVLGVGVEGIFEQCPSLLGRELEHCFLTFTQVQQLHELVRLHLQHSNPFSGMNGSTVHVSIYSQCWCLRQIMIPKI